jgi:hypothetical protein
MLALLPGGPSTVADDRPRANASEEEGDKPRRRKKKGQ